MSCRGSEDALRKAYSDRIKCLGRKLQGPGSSGSISGSRLRRNTDSSHISLQGDAEQEVDALVQRIRALCQERQAVRRKIEETDRRNANVARDLQAKLVEAQLQHSELAQEQARLQQALLDDTQEHENEVSRLDHLKDQRVRQYELEAEKLREACQLATSHLRTLQAEAFDYQNRIAQLGQERANAHNETAATIAAQNAAKAELEGLWSRVRQSEAERQELEEKYNLVGQRFEYVLETSEKENLEAVKALKSQVHNWKRKAEKQRRKVDDAKAKLEDLQRAQAQQSGALRDRDLEIQQLREACQRAREDALRHEEHFYESQQRALQDQAMEMEKMDGSMPLAAHQKILKEQGDYYRASMRELEEVLRQRLKAQEETLKRELRLQDDAMSSMREQYHQQEVQQMQKIREQQHLLHQQREEGLQELQSLHNDAITRCQLLDIEVDDAQGELARIESAAASAEEQRRLLASSLDVATKRLGQLRDLLAVERRNKADAQSTLADARKRLESLQTSIAEAEVQLETEADVKSNHDRLEALLNNHKQSVASLNDSITELRDKTQRVAMEVSTLRVQRAEGETRLEALKSRVCELQRTKSETSRAIHKKQEVLMRMRLLLSGHAGLFRHSMADIQKRIKDEYQAFQGDMQVWTQQWQRVSSSCLERSANQHRRAQDAATAEALACDDISKRLEALRSVGVDLKQNKERMANSVALLGSACDQLRSKVHQNAMSAERIIRTISAALPEGLSESTTQALLNAVGVRSGGGDTTGAAPIDGGKHFDSICALDTELKHSLEASRKAALEAERQRCADLAAQRRAKREEADNAQFAELSKKHTEVQAETANLSAEIKRLMEGHEDSALSATGVSTFNTLATTAGDVPTADTCAREEKLLREQCDHIAQLDAEIESENVKLAAAVQRVANARSALEDQSVEASIVAEEARREAKEPLERELQEARAQLEKLRASLISERQRRESEWQEHERRVIHQYETEQHRMIAKLREEVLQLKEEHSRLGTAQAAALSEKEAAVTRINAELAATLRKIEDAEDESRQLINVRDARQRGAKRLQEHLSKLEQQFQDIEKAKRRDEKDAEEDERQLVARHEEAMARLRRQRDSEISRLESAMQDSLTNLSAELSSDGDAALLTHSQLRASAERLAERARSQLDGTRA